MKKSILFSALALIAFSTATIASVLEVCNHKPLISHELPKGSPLHVAIQKGEIDLVKKMIEYGADVNEVSLGLTPLMVAARYNKVEIIRYLLSHGAHADKKDEKGFTALRYAELSLANEAALVLKQA